MSERYYYDDSDRRRRVAAAVGGGFSAEALQFFARVSDPGATRKGHYNTLINALVAAGVWSKLDVLCVLAAADSTTARVNLKSSSFGAIVSGSPTFTIDRGYAGDGAAAALDTNFAPAAGGVNFVQNDAHFSAWNRTSRAGDDTNIMGLTDGTENNIFCRHSSNNVFIRVNDTSGGSGGFANTASSGWFCGVRTSSAARAGYRNGVSIGTYGSVTSAALPTAPGRFWVLANGSTSPSAFTSDECAAYSIGGSLTPSEVTAFYNALLAYLQAVGAA